MTEYESWKCHGNWGASPSPLRQRSFVSSGLLACPFVDLPHPIPQHLQPATGVRITALAHGSSMRSWIDIQPREISLHA